MIRRFPDFDVELRIRNDQFVNPPRQAQRNWLLSRALDEFAADLKHLNTISKDFVSGTDLSGINDRTHSKLEEQEIMEDWQMPLMRAMAHNVTDSHGDILEIGLGRAVSSTYIQDCGVKSHTIVECNNYIVEHFFPEWRSRYPDKDIRLIHGKWQDVIDQLELYDGIFFHTYPLNETEFIEQALKSTTFAGHFFPTAAAHLRKGGSFTYLTHEIESLSREHQRLIFKHFRSFILSVVGSLPIPENCIDAWWADSMAVIKAIK